MSGKIEIDEKGFIKNLKRLGFTHHQCFAELMTNSLDAKAKNINIIKNKKDVRIIDDGVGMNMDLLIDKYKLMKQRNRTRDTTGCAGIGGTASEFILAKEKSIVLSKMEDCEDIVVAEVNWMLAHNEFKLFDSIHFRLAAKEESELFYSERNGNHGTTTVLYFIPEDDNKIQEVLENQFDVKKKKKINPFERFDIIFGLKRCNITYNYWKNTNTLSLNLYNIRDYLNDNMNYKSNRYEIQILRNLDNKDEYIYVADNRVIDVHGTTSKGKNSYKSKLSKYHPYAETEKVGILVLHLYNPYQTDRFNLELPSLPGAGNILNDFEKKFFENDSTSRDFIMEMQVYRNNHYIGNKKLSKDFNRTNSRANGSAANKLFYSRSFLEFFVESNEDDINTPILDDFFGVQLNKNQNNQNTLPIPLPPSATSCWSSCPPGRGDPVSMCPLSSMRFLAERRTGDANMAQGSTRVPGRLLLEASFTSGLPPDKVEPSTEGPDGDSGRFQAPRCTRPKFGIEVTGFAGGVTEKGRCKVW